MICRAGRLLTAASNIRSGERKTGCGIKLTGARPCVFSPSEQNACNLVRGANISHDGTLLKEALSIWPTRMLPPDPKKTQSLVLAKVLVRCMCNLMTNMKRDREGRLTPHKGEGEEASKSLTFNHKRRKMTPSSRKTHKQLTRPRVIHSVNGDLGALRIFNCDVSLFTHTLSHSRYPTKASRGSDFMLMK